jgi:hypothetical protein
MPGPPTPRTTPTLVEGIIEVQTGIDLTPFIQMANDIVTRVCGNSGYTDGYVGSTMEMIERWLSAHFYTVFDNQLAAAKAGTASVAFQYKVDYGFKSSMYGQQAMRLDTAGGLAKLDNSTNIKRQIKIRIDFIGRDPHRRFPGEVDGDQWADLTVVQ